MGRNDTVLEEKNQKEITKKKRKKQLLLIGLGLLLIVFIVVGFYNGLRVTRLEYANAKIPAEFDGYKIVQISDLHCAMFGEEQKELIRCIKQEEPDLIVITGDMFDEKRWNYKSLQKLLDGISDVAPIYAVTGNNEYDNQGMYDMLTELYGEYEVTLLQDEGVVLKKGEASIYLYGMYYRNYLSQEHFTLRGEPNQFNILLYHDPSQFEKLYKNGFDLILSGHTHGGVIRLPFVGGLIGNDGKFLPKYDYGMFELSSCDMFVSAGLGNMELPRFYNRPEVVSITLRVK